MTCIRSLFRVAVIAVALVGGAGLAEPSGAHAFAADGVIGPGSGRTGSIVAAVVALVGVIIAGLAHARSSGRFGAGNGRTGAVAALALGLIGIALAALHLATNTGAIGTGSGRLGAFVALGLGLIGTALGRRVLARSRRSG